MVNYKTPIIIIILITLYGCATPITKEDSIPKYNGQAPANINIVVSDHRSYIVNGGKEEWFEGIFRGPFWIPISPKRSGDNKGEPFAFYLAKLLGESFTEAGSKANIIQIEKGMEFDNILGKIKGDSKLQSKPLGKYGIFKTHGNARRSYQIKKISLSRVITPIPMNTLAKPRPQKNF